MATDLPDGLAGTTFRVSAARSEGVPRARLRRSDLERTAHGLRTDRIPGPWASWPEYVAALTTAFPEVAACSHVTAARLLGLPLPPAFRGDPWSETVDVVTRIEGNRVRRDGCTGHRGIGRRRVVLASGVPVTSPEDTWCDLAGLFVCRRPLLTDEDVLVVGDAVAARAGTTAGFADLVARRRKSRGVGRVRRIAPLVRTGSRSPAETRSRLLFSRAGLPEPELNAAVADEAGEWVVTSDFVWRDRRVIGEYQGADHFGDFARGDDDILRRRLTTDLGWTYIDFTRLDLSSPARRHVLLLRLAAALGVDPTRLDLDA